MENRTYSPCCYCRSAVGRTRHLLIGGESHVHQEGTEASNVWHDTLSRAQLEDFPQRPLPHRRQRIGSAGAAAYAQSCMCTHPTAALLASFSTRSRKRSCTRLSSSLICNVGSTRTRVGQARTLCVLAMQLLTHRALHGQAEGLLLLVNQV